MNSQTHRESVLAKYKLEDRGYSLSELSNITSIPRRILQQVYNRGIGAYKNNPQSVRLKNSYIKNVNAPMSQKLSKEQWAMARVYSFIDDNPKHDNDLRLSKNTSIIQGKFIGGFIKSIADFLFGKATTRVKNFLKEHGNDKITSLELGRTPVSSMIDTVLNLISSGKFEEAKRKEGFDKFYHLFLIVNGKYKIEKNQNLNIQNYSKSENEENEPIEEITNATINQFFQTCIDKIGEDNFFSNYSALNQNCQWLLKNLLNSNGITSGDNFIYQDVKNIKETVGTTTEYIANQTTDLASGIDKLISFISSGRFGLKRGGRVKKVKLI
jgi:hypothetical protein